MRYRIVHEIPGRIRIRCLEKLPGPDCNLRLDGWAAKHDPIICAAFSARTGNLIVQYEKTASRSEILRILDETSLFGDAGIGMAENMAAARRGSEFDLLLSETAMALVELVLPRPVARLGACWKWGCMAQDLVNAREGSFTRTVLSLVKSAILSLLGPAQPLRLALTIVLAAIDAAIASLFASAPTRRMAPVPVGFACAKKAM